MANKKLKESAALVKTLFGVALFLGALWLINSFTDESSENRVIYIGHGTGIDSSIYIYKNRIEGEDSGKSYTIYLKDVESVTVLNSVAQITSLNGFKVDFEFQAPYEATKFRKAVMRQKDKQRLE